MVKHIVGLGDINSAFRVYIGNTPDVAHVKTLDEVRAVTAGEIKAIGDDCGNGWRKVFNVYAKLVFALKWPEHHTEFHQSWQSWRDDKLLRDMSNTLLLFSAPDVKPASSGIHLVMGKHYAGQYLHGIELHWINHEFAINKSLRLIVCPYFDYRQLSNQKIVFLCDLIRDNNWME